VIAAARLGELWGTDPIALLDCTQEEWLIRIACAKVVGEERAEARERKGRDANPNLQLHDEGY
jgi:hypothetical protein